MKQLLQVYRSGEIRLCEVPVPALRPKGVLVSTRASLISSGTELALLRESQASILERARRRPDTVRKILKAVATHGLKYTYDLIQDRLADLVAMGYSASGEVIAIGPGVGDLKVGQRVACAGVGYATHSEVNFVPRNLCHPIAENTSFEEAAFVALGAVALEGVRQAEVSLGDVVAVMGLGLVGQIAVRLLHSAGCQVVGTDLLEDRLHQAQGYARAVPPDDFAPAVLAASGGHGADAVILAASTPSNELMVTAARLARMRGRLVVVGTVGMDLERAPFYSRELDIRFSMSYGPGRYDPAYEEEGHDYPYGLVRWTEGRNMAAVLDLAARGRLNLRELISHRFSIDRATEGYSLLESGRESCMGILITYDRPQDQRLANKRVVLTEVPRRYSAEEGVRLGMIGAGEFARTTLLPAIRRCPRVSLVGLATASGRTALVAGKRSGFEYGTCDYGEILRDSRIDAVVIVTRHHLHAPQVVEALQAGKHVFVEKPLALSLQELQQIHQAHQASAGLSLLVGHNRRFSRAVEEMRAFFAHRASPMSILYRINAGPVPSDHWTRGAEGGGLWLGEGSHYVDLACALCGSIPVSVFAATTDGRGEGAVGRSWNVIVTLADGSSAVISYGDHGDRRLPKERCEVYADDKAALLDDFHRLDLYAAGRKRTVKLDDKGHATQMTAFFEHLSGGKDLGVTLEDQLVVAGATILCKQSAETGRVIPVRLTDILADQPSVR